MKRTPVMICCTLGHVRGCYRPGAGAVQRDRHPYRDREDRRGTGLPRHLRESLPAERPARRRTWRWSGARGAGRGAAAGAPQTPDRANWYAPPFKVFDNLYWLGTRQHSSWALQTSAGIIIIDTNFAWATEPEIIEGLTKLGLNPRDIKYVIISHAHGDHDQGAAELQKRFGAKVVMGAPTGNPHLQRPATAAGGVPKRDIAVGPEGMKLTLGDTTVEIVATPGHTPGTLSYVFPVKDQGRTGDGRLFRRHTDRRVRHRRRAME